MTGYIRMVMHCFNVFFLSFNTCRSVNQPTLVDYKLQMQMNTHSVIGALIIKEVLQQGRVNELIPPPLKQWY